MRLRVERISTGIAGGLESEAGIECVTLGKAAEEDILDPYFTLVLDVYGSPPFPAEETRRKVYGNPLPFETAVHEIKDRFFVESCPVHVQYHSTDAIDALVSGKDAVASALRETGTHPFYRLHECKVLFSRTGWIDRTREATRDLPEDFWNGLVAAFSAKLEHFLSDLGASVLVSDDFFSTVSLAGFLSYMVSTLFALNRRYEPAYRFTMRELPSLKSLPEDFFAMWGSLTRPEGQSSFSRKYEIAKLLAVSVFSLIH